MMMVEPHVCLQLNAASSQNFQRAIFGPESDVVPSAENFSSTKCT